MRMKRKKRLDWRPTLKRSRVDVDDDLHHILNDPHLMLYYQASEKAYKRYKQAEYCKLVAKALLFFFLGLIYGFLAKVFQML